MSTTYVTNISLFAQTFRKHLFMPTVKCFDSHYTTAKSKPLIHL